MPVATQMPDTFVYLVKGTNSKPKHRICYLRLPTAELVAGGLTKPARWHQMHRDKAVDGLKDGQFPGSLLLRLGLSDATSVDAEDEASWIADLKRLSIAPKHYELWVRVHR